MAKVFAARAQSRTRMSHVSPANVGPLIKKRKGFFLNFLLAERQKTPKKQKTSKNINPKNTPKSKKKKKTQKQKKKTKTPKKTNNTKKKVDNIIMLTGIVVIILS